jgi:hypothetical protein
VTDPVLDALIKTLERNPLDRVAMNLPPVPHVPVDDKPFYQKKEAVPTKDMNSNFRRVVDIFHGPDTYRLERPRRGSCGRQRVVVEDGRAYVESMCGGEVHAVETLVPGGQRVDGKCLKCGWELHRAGLSTQDAPIWDSVGTGGGN